MALSKLNEAPIECTRPSPNWFFEAIAGYFEHKSSSVGIQDRDFQIAGQTVRLRFAAPFLRDCLSRAFAHLEVKSTRRPDLTVRLWDADPPRESSILLRAYLTALQSNWWDFLTRRGELLEFHAPPMMAAYHPGSMVLSMLDLSRGEGLYWCFNRASIPYYEAGSPLRTMLHWWFRTQGLQFVHAAAVGTEAGGVLLAGKGGSGKSTSALACVGAGLRYAGDDYCIASTGEQPWVHSLYNTCKLVGEADLERFPGMSDRIWNPVRVEGEKPTVFLEEHWPAAMSNGFPIRAILAPCITGQKDSFIRPCRVLDAITALAPSTLAQLPSSGQEDLQNLTGIVKSVPAFRLHLGTDLAQIPMVIRDLLAGMPDA